MLEEELPIFGGRKILWQSLGLNVNDSWETATNQLFYRWYQSKKEVSCYEKFIFYLYIGIHTSFAVFKNVSTIWVSIGVKYFGTGCIFMAIHANHEYDAKVRLKQMYYNSNQCTAGKENNTSPSTFVAFSSTLSLA